MGWKSLFKALAAETSEIAISRILEKQFPGFRENLKPVKVDSKVRVVKKKTTPKDD